MILISSDQWSWKTEGQMIILQETWARTTTKHGKFRLLHFFGHSQGSGLLQKEGGIESPNSRVQPTPLWVRPLIFTFAYEERYFIGKKKKKKKKGLRRGLKHKLNTATSCSCKKHCSLLSLFFCFLYLFFLLLSPLSWIMFLSWQHLVL